MFCECWDILDIILYILCLNTKSEMEANCRGRLSVGPTFWHLDLEPGGMLLSCFSVMKRPLQRTSRRNAP
jgi:hypothetical protein